MRSLEVREQEGRYVAALVEVEDPRPKPGEVLVRVAASGLNRADLSQIAGRYPPPPGESPILGLEVSGRLASTGEAVSALLAGGGHAEAVAAPEGQVFPAPRRVGLIEAAAIPEAFLTAFLNLRQEASLAAGETVLIHAGASGVGLAAIGVARLSGARVAATTRTAAKIPSLREARADLAVDTSAENLVETIEKAWGPHPVHVILDPVGAATLGQDLDLLATGGRVIFLATMSGRRAELDLRTLMSRRGRLIGSTLRSRSREEKARIVRAFREEVLPAFETGKLRVSIDSIVSPGEASAAFTRMRQNRNAGKILIDWTRESEIGNRKSKGPG